MALNVKAKGQGYSLAFGYKERLIDVDLNDYAGKAGVYFVGQACTNRPESSGPGFMVVVTDTSDWVQIMLPLFSSQNLYFRCGNVFTKRVDPWKKIGGGYLKTCFALRNLVSWGYSHAEGKWKSAAYRLSGERRSIKRRPEHAQDSGILLRRGRVHKSSGPGFHMVDSDGAPNTSDSFRNAGFNTANISWSLFRTCVFTAVQRGTWKLEQLDKHHDVLDSIGGVVYA